MRYKYIIFDADHTILDFDADERRAFAAAFRAAGISPTPEMIESCWAFSAQNWCDLGLHRVHLPAVQAGYHALYADHVRDIMRYAGGMSAAGARISDMERVFCEELSRASHCVEGAERVIAALSLRCRVCVATNGLTAMQTGRLSALAPRLYRIFISEAIGAIKPSAAFFGAMTASLGTQAERCLMVGDSLTSDVAGANAAGMDCVWFNRTGAPLPPGYRVAAVVSRLDELLDLL